MEETCISYKTDGHRCGKVPTNGNPRCGLHHRTHQRYVALYGPLPEHRCQIVNKVGRHKTWCFAEHLPGSTICHHHTTIFALQAARQQAREAEEREILTATFVFEARNLAWRDVVHGVIDEWNQDHPMFEYRFRVAHLYFIRNTQLIVTHLYNYWDWVLDGGIGPDPTIEPPRITRRTLAQLAADPQSVHTTEVVAQTNESLKVLLDAADKLTGQAYTTPDWLAGQWLVLQIASWKEVRETVDDMQKWYAKATCCTTNDKLYYRALTGLGAIISETKDVELLKRAFEECNESIGMCCEGHLGRLVNVLVGFHENVAPPVPVGEMLQQKIGAISMLDISTDEKVYKAMEVLSDLNVPQAEHSVWLDALA